jgi:hypothetical protein
LPQIAYCTYTHPTLMSLILFRGKIAFKTRLHTPKEDVTKKKQIYTRNCCKHFPV